MNDLTLSWKKISRGLPIGRRAANDRAPTIEEIQKLVEYPDRRIKPIIYTMASSGIRNGALNFSEYMVNPYTYKNFEITEEPSEDTDPNAAASIAGFELKTPFGR